MNRRSGVEAREYQRGPDQHVNLVVGVQTFSGGTLENQLCECIITQPKVVAQ